MFFPCICALKRTSKKSFSRSSKDNSNHRAHPFFKKKRYYPSHRKMERASTLFVRDRDARSEYQPRKCIQVKRTKPFAYVIKKTTKKQERRQHFLSVFHIPPYLDGVSLWCVVVKRGPMTGRSEVCKRRAIHAAAYDAHIERRVG